MAGVPELGDWRRFCLSQQMSPQEKTSPGLVLILTPNDLNQTYKNYSYKRAVGIIICLQKKETSSMGGGCHWLLLHTCFMTLHVDDGSTSSWPAGPMLFSRCLGDTAQHPAPRAHRGFSCLGGCAE